MRLPILLYHWFDPGMRGPSGAPEFGIDPGHFRRQMDWLASRGRAVVSLAELSGSLSGGASPPAASAAITFDDAYEDFHEHALPVLAGHGFPAAVFAVSGLVGRSNAWDRPRGEPKRRLMDWPRLREAAGLGIEIGSHSRTHPDLRTLSDDALREECRGSRRELEDGLGRAVRFFAYPHGRHDARVRAAAREAGYEAACAVLLRPSDLLRSERFALMRVIVHGTRGFGSFRRRVRLAAPRHRAA